MIQVRRQLPLYGVIAAGGFSRLGNAVAGLALPWLVLSLTGSAMWTGVAAAAGMAPLIVGAFFGGAAIDRFGPRRVAVAADLVSAASVAATSVLLHLEALSVVALILLIALGALFDGPGMTAQEARYPELARLAGMRLERVTSLDELLDGGAVLVGPPLAAIAITILGMESTLWIMVACSLAAAELNRLSLPRRRHREANRADRKPDRLVGIRFLFGDPLLRSILVVAMIVVAAFAALDAVVMPVLLRESGGTALDLGLFLAAAGAGAAAGALAFAAWGQHLNQRAVLLFGLAGEAIAVAALALQSGQAAMLAAGAVAGLAAGPLPPLVSTVLLRRTPATIRGHVLGAATAMALVVAPPAVLAAGVAIEGVGARALLLGTAVGLAALAARAAFSPGLRRLDGASAVTALPDAPSAAPDRSAGAS